MRIRPLEKNDADQVRVFYRLRMGDSDGSKAQAVLKDSTGVAAEDKEKGILAVGFMRPSDSTRYDLVDVAVRPDYRNMGLENQMLLTLEILAEKRRAKIFAVWMKSDACDDFSYDDMNERMRYHERGYVFTAYRVDWFGPGLHADRLDKELKEMKFEPAVDRPVWDSNVSLN